MSSVLWRVLLTQLLTTSGGVNILTEAHEVSESDQGQPTGGQAESVEATAISPSWIEVSGRAGCELNAVWPSARCSWDAAVRVSEWAGLV